MTKETLKLSDYYIKKTNEEGLMKNDGTIDKTTYAQSSHKHKKEDIDNFQHTHGNISDDGKITTTESGADRTDNIVFVDNDKSIKATNKVSDYLINHNDSLNNLGLTSSDNNQHTINRAVNSKVGSINEDLKNALTMEDVENAISTYISNELIDLVYPVGAIYISVNNISPATLFGGTWEKIQGRFLLSSGTNANKNYNVNQTGGNKDATVVEHEHNAKHSHTQSAHSHTQQAHSHCLPSGYYFLGVKDYNGGSNAPNWLETSNYYSFGKLSSGDYSMLVSKDASYVWEPKDTEGRTPTINSSQPSIQEANFNTSKTGQSGTDANMPPYLVVNMWKRTK